MGCGVWGVECGVSGAKHCTSNCAWCCLVLRSARWSIGRKASYVELCVVLFGVVWCALVCVAVRWVRLVPHFCKGLLKEQHPQLVPVRRSEARLARLCRARDTIVDVDHHKVLLEFVEETNLRGGQDRRRRWNGRAVTRSGICCAEPVTHLVFAAWVVLPLEEHVLDESRVLCPGGRFKDL